jgi:phosphatidylglycerophosphatase C
MLHVVQIETAAQIQRRIAAARDASPGGLVACDGDGTLWTGDVGEDLFHALVAKGPLLAPAAAQLRADAKEHGLDDGGTAQDVARRIYHAYLAHAFPEERVCEMMTWAFAGWTHDAVVTFAREVIASVGLDARIHAEVTTALAWARAEGIEIFLVSASPRVVVEEAALRVGIDAAHVLAATPLYEGGTMLPAVERPIPYGDGKVGAIRAAAHGRTVYAAFGDNAFDVAMLREAKVPVAVRPKDRLRARAAEVVGLVEIAAI